MGNDRPHMKQQCIRAVLAVVALATYCFPAIATQPEKQTMQTTQKTEFKNAQDFIEFFRQGGKYYDKHKNLPSLMIGNQPNPEAMKALGEELATSTDDVRDRIISLLEDIGRFSYPAYELRTPEVIDLMVGPGFAKGDSARSEAMDLLRKYASTATLSRYGDVFLKALKEDPEGSALLLIAKVKPNGAREEVNRLSRLPEWKDEPEMHIALAALGNTKIEDKYIAEAKRKEEAGDATGLAESFNPLARIGTPRSLSAICQRLRSPLVVVHVRQESIRLKAMEALIYAFPEEEILLNPSNVLKEEDYTRVEQFCTKTLGIRFDGMPRPEFFTTLEVW